jgi:alpha-N-dichloroacetyl-p-aminophenylserinol N-oxygenase
VTEPGPRTGDPALPAHDPADPVESAVIARLAGNWTRRASVKRDEPDLDDLFEADRPDYPERLLPFRDHPVYLGLPEEQRARLRGWAWISFNKNVQDVEQYVVNPAFQLVTAGAFDTGLGETAALAVMQGMVDEQYHTLMHMNASAVTRRRRGWAMPDSALPLAHKPRLCAARQAAADHRWQRELTLLAYATVAEISINAYLDLIAGDPDIQPVNRATAELHNRDEYCHASFTAEIARAAFHRLDAERRTHFVAELADGLAAFAANDYGTWHRVMEVEGVPDGRRMLLEVEHDAGRARLLQDFSGLHELCTTLGITEETGFDWSTVAVG